MPFLEILKERQDESICVRRIFGTRSFLENVLPTKDWESSMTPSHRNSPRSISAVFSHKNIAVTLPIEAIF